MLYVIEKEQGDYDGKIVITLGQGLVNAFRGTDCDGCNSNINIHGHGAAAGFPDCFRGRVSPTAAGQR